MSEVQQLQFRGMGPTLKDEPAERSPLPPIQPLGNFRGQQRLILSPAYEAFKRQRKELGI